MLLCNFIDVLEKGCFGWFSNIDFDEKLLCLWFFDYNSFWQVEGCPSKTENKWNNLSFCSTVVPQNTAKNHIIPHFPEILSQFRYLTRELLESIFHSKFWSQLDLEKSPEYVLRNLLALEEMGGKSRCSSSTIWAVFSSPGILCFILATMFYSIQASRIRSGFVTFWQFHQLPEDFLAKYRFQKKDWCWLILNKQFQTQNSFLPIPNDNFQDCLDSRRVGSIQNWVVL